MLALMLLNRLSIMSGRRRMSRREKPTKVDKIVKRTEDVKCRTCLITGELMPLFQDIDHEKRSHDLLLVTGLQIKKGDGLSQKICAQCLDMINQVMQFRRTCRKAEKSLINTITGVKTKKKYKTRLRQTLSKHTKVKRREVEGIECDYPYDMYDDDFQDHDDYKEVRVKEERSKIGKLSKKKRLTIPNATSYKCTTCNKEFKMKTTYKAHIRFHTNYCVCESCGKRCRNNNQLQEHKRARHGLGRIHKCAYCEYSSATKEALTIHERRHTGERPYVCDHCGATFHRRSNLVQHIAIHLPEKNFQCSICNKCEKSKKRLQIHVYKIHRSREQYRYLCPACGESFARAYNVRKHMARAHHMHKDDQPTVHRIQVHLPIMPEKLLPSGPYVVHKVPTVL